LILDPTTPRIPYHDLYTYPRPEEGVVRKFEGKREKKEEDTWDLDFKANIYIIQERRISSFLGRSSTRGPYYKLYIYPITGGRVVRKVGGGELLKGCQDIGATQKGHRKFEGTSRFSQQPLSSWCERLSVGGTFL
jgi:hypothetical protein